MRRRASPAPALVHFASTHRRGLLATAGVLGLMNLLRWQLARFTVEKPRYEVLRRAGPVEIRRYPPMVFAETEVEGRFDEALREGFRRLARYIFGSNDRAANAPARLIRTAHEKLAMTAPVTTQPQNGARTVAFVMPSRRSMTDLPRPHDPRVHLRQQDAQTIAALKFRGRYGEGRVREAAGELMAELAKHGLRAKGEPTFAGYDPPFTLPPLRRNEVWVELV